MKRLLLRDGGRHRLGQRGLGVGHFRGRHRLDLGRGLRLALLVRAIHHRHLLAGFRRLQTFERLAFGRPRQALAISFLKVSVFFATSVETISPAISVAFAAMAVLLDA